MKVFSDRPAAHRRIDFAIDFWDGDRSERHAFNAYPGVDAFALAKINHLAGNDRTAVNALIEVKNYIRGMLDDNDGTPLDWRADPLPASATVPSGDLAVWPDDEDVLYREQMDAPKVSIVGGLDDDADPEPQFLAPDGTVHPMREASKYLDFSAASSRRRWVELMDGDNNLRVEAKTIMKVWQYLVSESADRPTVR